MDTSPDGLRIIDSLERDFTNLRVIDAALKASLIQRLDELRSLLAGCDHLWSAFLLRGGADTYVIKCVKCGAAQSHTEQDRRAGGDSKPAA